MLVTVIADLICEEGTWREGSHTAGVQARITVARPLVILGRRHQLVVSAVTEGQGGDLPSGHEFLNDKLIARRPELLVCHDFLYPSFGLFKILTDQNPLAQSQAVRL